MDDVAVQCGSAAETDRPVLVDIQGSVATVVGQETVNLPIMVPGREECDTRYPGNLVMSLIQQSHCRVNCDILESDKSVWFSEIAMHHVTTVCVRAESIPAQNASINSVVFFISLLS